jgi:hypothetical protein
MWDLSDSSDFIAEIARVRKTRKFFRKEESALVTRYDNARNFECSGGN